MNTQQFLLCIAEGSAENCHFELRLDEDERLFHVSFRLAVGRYVMNEMRAGVWGEGVWHDLPDGFDAGQPVLVHRRDAEVFLFIGGDCTTFAMTPEALTERPLRANAEGIDWRYLGADKAARVVPVAGATARIEGVAIARTTVALPEALPPALALRIVTGAVQEVPDYLRFLAAAGFPVRMPVLASENPALALSHAALFAQAPVVVLSHHVEAVEAIARANGMANLTALTPAQWQEQPPAWHGPALILGDGATLPKSCTPHTYSPGAPLDLPERPSAPAAMPEPASNAARLDIIVALFNTRAHVQQCVESLLCTGRADIRVIVVDDGSSDGSGDLVRDAFSGDARVQVVSKANGGCASARNYGRLVSDAAHIAFVDADDCVDPEFFAGLYDLARATGDPMIQGGFDFIDESRDPARWPFGGDLELADLPLESVAGMQAQRVPSMRLMRSQPTIWRKVYRRDFLDRNDIWFPESIRAYDDYLFHLMTLTYLPESWMLPGPKYLYRQHPAQDIRQGDTRHFNMLAMFSMLMRRAQAEGWRDFSAHAQTMLDAVHWSSERLRPELVSAFLQAAARICAAVARAWGPQVMGQDQLATVAHPDFRTFFDAETALVAAMPDGAWWSQTTDPLSHPDVARMALTLKRSL